MSVDPFFTALDERVSRFTWAIGTPAWVRGMAEINYRQGAAFGRENARGLTLSRPVVGAPNMVALTCTECRLLCYPHQMRPSATLDFLQRHEHGACASCREVPDYLAGAVGSSVRDTPAAGEPK